MNDIITPPAIIQPAGAELANLATAINAEHEQAQRAVRSGLEHAMAAGKLLIEAKGRLRHGEWLPWLKANCRVAERTARAYMQVAGRQDELKAKSATVADLTFREAAKILSAPAEPTGEPIEMDEETLLASQPDRQGPTLAERVARIKAMMLDLDESLKKGDKLQKELIDSGEIELLPEAEKRRLYGLFKLVDFIRPSGGIELGDDELRELLKPVIEDSDKDNHRE